ncbi:MAG: SEC-C metal-binding domain-containing protein [Acidimicrobiales bacterium]
MDLERLALLFGDEVLDALDEFDLDHEAGRLELVERFAGLPAGPTEPGGRAGLRAVIVNQVLDDDPPHTWSTVQRLHDLGLDGRQILSQLAIVVGEQLSAALADDQPFAVDDYVQALDDLPLPERSDVADRIVTAVRSGSGPDASECLNAVISSYQPLAGAVIERQVDQVFDRMLGGPLHLLPDDRVVLLPDLVDGTTFTHRLTDIECDLGALTVSFDLAAFDRLDLVRLADGTELEPFSVEDGHLGWGGPEGWLARFEPGALISCTVAVDPSGEPGVDPVAATITVEAADHEPAVTDAAAGLVRAGYDRLTAELALPVAADDLVWWLLFHHRDLFAELQPPLADLCDAASLERRGSELGHDEDVWRTQLFVQRFRQAAALVPEPRWRQVLSNALQVLDDPDAPIDDVRSALAETAAPEVLDALADALFPHHLSLEDQFELGWADAPGRLFELVGRATAVARRPAEVATAEYLSAVLHERCGAPETAEDHLKRAAEAQPRLGPVVERLGWYRFDRGDASSAMQWWRTLSTLPEAARTIEPFLSPTGGASRIGRNDLCWCGSGRKFKRCHQGSAALPALPDRVGWLCRKASLWIDHSTGDVRRSIVELAWAWASGDPDGDPVDLASIDDEADFQRIGEAFSDPILFDAALHEGGLYRLFLYERGVLLPEDEQLLVTSWTAVDRSVHEVVAVDPGVGVTLRDLATGEVLEVQERTASTTMGVGERYCARVVPDGVGHQIIGGVFPVRTGNEVTVLDLCAAHDPMALCAWAGARLRPPQLVHRPGLIDEMFDRDAIETLLQNADDDPDTAMATVRTELARQAQARWLDDHIPALGGLTPREAAADPTRREQLERLLAEFETDGRRGPSGPDLPDGFTPFRYDVDAMRRELGLG